MDENDEKKEKAKPLFEAFNEYINVRASFAKGKKAPIDVIGAASSLILSIKSDYAEVAGLNFKKLKRAATKQEEKHSPAWNKMPDDWISQKEMPEIAAAKHNGPR